MSIKNWPGGLIRKTPPTPSGPYQDSTAPGIWTLTQVANYIKQGIWPTAGNTSPNLYIENLFSTYLYTGNGSSQTITNGIDLSNKGGLVWIKQRSAARNNLLFDTLRGATKPLYSNLDFAEGSDAQSLTAFTSTGFSVGSDSGCNINAGTYVAWTFREQAKFFDVVTYTGNGSNRTVAHNLGSTPGCIIVKKTSGVGPWPVYHRSLTDASTSYVNLNETSARGVAATYWNSTAPTSTVFSLGTSNDVNQSGETYVAYLFAHDAGGFGTSGTENVISCGSYAGSGVAGNNISVGFEAQWVLIKRTNTAQDWFLFDNMRGMCAVGSGSSDPFLNPNLSDAEVAGDYVGATATGFVLKNTASALNASGGQYIYIAIRRGPMKTPTSGTSVFEPDTYTGNNSTQVVGSDVLSDLYIAINRSTVENKGAFINRLVGGFKLLVSTETSADQTTDVAFDRMTGIGLKAISNYGYYNESPKTYVGYNLRRAPGFFDEVCYTGTGSATTQAHNLGVAPELMIVKSRSGSTASYNWTVYSAALGATKGLYLNTTGSANTETYYWNDTAPTASVFSLGNGTFTNASSQTYVAYLFATCPGVSKVGSYTGTGTTLQVNCGFTSGARFVMIKRTDSTGDWYVWDSARGIVAGNDPYLLLNSTAAEVTNTDYVDTYSAGFEISSTAPAAINANGGTFIFLAIA